MGFSAKTAARRISRDERLEADLHAYTAEQLYACAERAALYLKDFTDEDVAAVQAFLLICAKREVDSAYDALGETGGRS